MTVFVFVVATAACSKIEVKHKFDPNVDYTTYKTFDWAGPQELTGDPRIDDEALDKRIRRAIEHQLVENGYKKVTSGKPDFLLVYHAAINDDFGEANMNQYYENNPNWEWGWNFEGQYGKSGYATNYEMGTLVIDIMDDKTKTPVWRGAAQAEVDRYAEPEKRDKLLKNSVKKILEKFPPKK